MYKAVKIVAGKGGWGGPLTLVPTDERHKIVSITGGGIHPVATSLAAMTGCDVIDGFTNGVPDNEILAVVVDCGGTARCGVYPKKRINTLNVMPVGKTGPLAKYITEDIYVSAVDESCFAYLDEAEAAKVETSAASVSEVKTAQVQEKAAPAQEKAPEAKKNIFTRIGIGIGSIISKFYAAGRETIDVTLKSILPFMAFVSMILGIIQASGIGDVIANVISPVASTLPGMLIISFICACRLFLRSLAPVQSLLRLLGLCSALRLGWEIFLRSMPCLHFSLSMHRPVVTSSRLA